MNQYIITEEELLDTRSYIYHEDEVAFSRIESKVRSHPHQSERDKVLNNKLASRYKALLVHCMDTIEDIRRKYTIAPKSCKSCSAYDLCEELRRAGEP